MCSEMSSGQHPQSAAFPDHGFRARVLLLLFGDAVSSTTESAITGSTIIDDSPIRVLSNEHFVSIQKSSLVLHVHLFPLGDVGNGHVPLRQKGPGFQQ